MGVRGPASSRELQIAPVAYLRPIPKSPEHLTDPQSDIWRLVMHSRAGELIPPESYPVVVEYCRAIVASDQVAEELDAFKPEWRKTDEGLRRWDKLLAMQDRLAGKIASLAVKLRITPSSRVHPEKAGTNARKNWEIAEGED
jgi:hypothetical protein